MFFEYLQVSWQSFTTNYNQGHHNEGHNHQGLKVTLQKGFAAAETLKETLERRKHIVHYCKVYIRPIGLRGTLKRIWN